MEQLSLSTFLKILKEKRLFLLIITTLSVVIGIVIAITTPRVYTSSAELVALKSTAGKSGIKGLGGLAGLAGLNVGGSEAGYLSPEIYSNVLNSTEFLLTLEAKKFYSPAITDSIGLQEYDINYGKTSLLSKLMQFPGRVASWMKGASNNQLLSSKEDRQIVNSEILEVSISKRKVLNKIKDNTEVNYNDQNDITSVFATHQDPYISAQMAQFSFEYLRAFLESHKSSQQRKKLNFIEHQLKNKTNEFREKQQNLAEYRDRNLGSLTNKATTELENLQSDYDLVFSLVNSLSQQREEAAIQLEEELGVFKVLEPVILPVSPSKPNRKMIVVSFLFLGVFIGVSMIFGKIYLSSLNVIKLKE